MRKLDRGKVKLKNYPSKQLLRLWNSHRTQYKILILLVIISIGVHLIVGSEEDKQLLDQLEKAVFDLCRTAEDFYSKFSSFDQRECVYFDTCDPQLERRIPFFDCVQGFGTGGECRCQGEKLSLKYPVVC
ncbi:predicted protein [Naegleria gruberi]|uniref:Predicted protein n=1 Tax=Naegleria gruberi TaxID=5762 RepID=D2V398_NAEGR|nr:uncharacterized protein NAEGRDRAFT_63279 [Naegleria gruberi]EFC48734.1 predicted protein [Naegleria gruberi]|eukprot:XP_002681478.1 predicted protein [Naegleria gruberi strain NEG-M]